MSKESYKNTIANRRKDIVSLRAKIVTVKNEKKKRMEFLSKNIKSTSSPISKESYRKAKISESTRYDSKVDSLKKMIESVKKQMEQTKKSLASLK